MPEPLNINSEIAHPSRVKELQYLNNSYRGWTTTNEDHLLLLESLKGTKRNGGFFAVGEFQALDVALQLGADVIVLGDLDEEAVKKNLDVLKTVETATKVEEVLPRIFEIIEKAEGKNGLNSFKEKITSDVTSSTGARIKLSWAKSKPEFERLKKLIKEGKVAVAQVDITDPESMKIVGAFFRSQRTSLNSAYLSNTISYDNFDDEAKREHQQAVRALYNADGTNKTLLIRSGQNTNPKTIKAILEHGHPYLTKGRDVIKEAQDGVLDRELHYGKTETLPDLIDRIISDSVFLYDFEFFTQELKDYEANARNS